MPIRCRLAGPLVVLALCGMVAHGADAPDKKKSADNLADNARTVLAAVVKAAGDNHRLPQRSGVDGVAFRRTDDELTAYYIRTAAKAARELPEKDAAPAFLLALGIALDDSTTVRGNLLTRRLWHKVESGEARKLRLSVLGEPMLFGRHDLAQHFAVSAALTATAGPESAESAGVLKEMLDSRAGGSGFSFADLSADFAGIAFARRLLDKPSRLVGIEKSFRTADYALSPRGLPEGLTAEQFAKQYGSLKDERYLRLQSDIRKRIAELPGYKDMAKGK